MFKVVEHVIAYQATVFFAEGGAIIPRNVMCTASIDITFRDVGHIAVVLFRKGVVAFDYRPGFTAFLAEELVFVVFKIALVVLRLG